MIWYVTFYATFDTNESLFHIMLNLVWYPIYFTRFVLFYGITTTKPLSCHNVFWKQQLVAGSGYQSYTSIHFDFDFIVENVSIKHIYQTSNPLDFHNRAYLYADKGTLEMEHNFKSEISYRCKWHYSLHRFCDIYIYMNNNTVFWIVEICHLWK